MSFKAFLIHRCWIYRPTPMGVGRYGQTTYDNISTILADQQPCRLVERMERVIDAETGEWGWVQQTRLYLPAAAIVGHMLYSGDVVAIDGIGTYRIREVMRRNRMRSQHHIMAVLEAYNPIG